MSDSRLGATLTAALAVETIGAVDPFGPSPSYLPAPRVYLATWVLWFVLGLVASTGETAARLAGQISVLVLLTMAVVGPFGGKLVHFLNKVGSEFPAGGAA